MFPEISRRCLGCGAAVRPGARFCPQCGQLMEREAKDGADAGAATLRDGELSGRGEEVRLEEAFGRWKESVAGAAGSEGRAEAPAAPAAPATPREAAPAPAREPEAPRETVLAAPAAPNVTAREPEAAGVDGGAGVRPSEEPAASTSPAPPLARPRPPAAEKGSRAAAVRESLRPRVERVREASRGVLEEAAEDSGLRFVIISVALFLLFLLFLLFNSRLR